MVNSEEQDIEIKQDSSKPSNKDGLLLSLVYITKHFGRTRSIHSLKSGLAFDDGLMLPNMFCLAANRAGIDAKIIKRKLKLIPNSVLPIVLILQDNKSAVLIDKNDKTGEYVIYDPEMDAEISLSFKELKASYSGYSIYIKELTQDSKLEVKQTHWFWSVIKDNASIYSKVILAAILINIFALTSPLYVMNIYDRVLPNKAVETGWVLTIGVISVYLFDLLIKVLRGYFIDVAGRKADVILARRIYDHVLDMKLDFKKSSNGQFINSLREFESIRDFFTSATVTGFIDFPFSLLFLGVIYLIGGPIAIALLALYVFVLLTTVLLQIPVKKYVQKSMQNAGARHGLLMESLNGLETIKGIGGEGKLRLDYTKYVAKSALWGQRSRFFSGLSTHISGFAQQLSSVIVIIIGMYLVNSGDLTTGGLIACVLIAGRAIAPIGQVSSLINRYHQAVDAYKNLNEVMAIPLEREVGKDFLYRPYLKGNYRFNMAEYKYPDTEENVLHNINFEVKAGTKLAIVGKTGSGKTSMIKMMLKFYEATSGTVLLDNSDIRQIDPADLRRNISYVGQETTLLSGTVRTNIIMGRRDATDEEILYVSKIAGVHDFISRHPLGYDAPVGENGKGFSGGQRQAIALARALLTNAPIMIFDEPTSAMDSFSEEMVIKNLREYLEDKTFILVTHKNNLLSLVDRILLMDDGRLLAEGPKEKMLDAIKNGEIKVPSNERIKKQYREEMVDKLGGSNE